MSLPMLAELPAILLPIAQRAEQSFRDAVAALDDDHGLCTWTPQRWADFTRVCAASDFVIEQSVRDPLMLPAKINLISAISNLCSTVLHRAWFLRSQPHAIYAPNKDRP